MDTSQQGFQLGILPERHIDRRAVATGYSVIVALLLILVNVAPLFPDRIELKQYGITALIPLPSMRPEPQPVPAKPAAIKAKLLPPAPVFDQPRLVVPRELHRSSAPDPVEAPRVVMNQFAPPPLKMPAAGARPQLLHTGDFAGSSAAPTMNAAVQRVQTGGFGDPNGLPGTGKQSAKLHAAPSGAFEMPVGAGQGNGSGGAKGIKGTIASADFGNGIANGGNGDGRSSGHNTVATGGFGSEQVVHNAPKIPAADSGPPTSSVEITFKPRPVYTDEARKMKLEGEVLLEVMFGANGSLQVIRVVRGLGHGLDEAAIAAANKMRFQSALRNGQPVDSTAVVHVSFQLAY